LKKLSVALALAGVLLGTALIAYSGAGNVARAVLSAGWAGFAAICAWQLMIFVPVGLAWDQIGRARGIRRPFLFVWARMVRDASGNCLPFSQVGGFVFGARTLIFYGFRWPVATATTVVDITAEFLSELAFVAIGLSIVLVRAPKADRIAVPVEVGLGLALVAAIAFVWLQRGAAPLFARMASRIAGRRMQGARRRLATVRMDMMEIHRHTGRLAASFALHLLGWLMSGLADWIAYRAIGAPIDVDAALAIESLLSAIGAVAFLVPVMAGVQEASYAGLGAIFGVPTEMSLAVSLIRRARDITVGIPILLVWQFLEFRRMRAAAPG
jgi:glycosyltransferase 2 family protein